MIKIVTDSSVQLTPAEVKDNNITVIPLTVEVNGKSYVDGEDITRPELVEELRKGNIPKTSQPAIGRFVDTFDKLGQDGSQVLAIMMSDVLSGTYQTAVSAAKMSTSDVYVINSKSTDRGLAFQVLAAVQNARAGKTIDEIREHCLNIYSRTTIDVLIDNLDCLVAGGRVSRMAGTLTKLINLKVIVRLRDKSLDVYSKGRSRKFFIKHCRDVVAKAHEDNPVQELSLSNVGTDSEFLQKIKDTILPENSNAGYISELTSPIIMTHTGLNAVGVITLAEKPEPDSYR